MKPLLVLLISFTLILLFTKIITGKTNSILAGKISFAIMLLFTALGHFLFTTGMTYMIPTNIPFKKTIVYGTGILEFFFCIGLFIPAYQKQISIVIIIFLILMLPANIRASMLKLDYQTGKLTGNGLAYLWFRIPLQFFFIYWVYSFCYQQKIYLIK